jgi:hypothetical protein
MVRESQHHGHRTTTLHAQERFLTVFGTWRHRPLWRRLLQDTVPYLWTVTYGRATWCCSKRFGFFPRQHVDFSRRLFPGRTPLRHKLPDCCHEKSNLRWPVNKRSRLCPCKRTSVCNSYLSKLPTDRPNILSHNRNLTLTLVALSFVLTEWCDAASLCSMTSVPQLDHFLGSSVRRKQWISYLYFKYSAEYGHTVTTFLTQNTEKILNNSARPRELTGTQLLPIIFGFKLWNVYIPATF